MNKHIHLGLLISSLFLLAACGSSVDGGNGGGGSGGQGTGGDGSGAGLCKGVPSSESCTEGSCPSGYVCVPDADPTTCHSSTCSCEDDGWMCTADCGMGGSTCVPDQTTCNGAPNPVSCTVTGCAAGFTCTPDPDPDTCHPSSCSCDAEGWVCTDDCGMGGSTCVKGL
jgi:hypothetical protein